MLPKWVQVQRAGNNGRYSVSYWAGIQWQQVASGNREEVHSWLGQHGYKQTSQVFLAFEGEYRREAGNYAA